MTKTQIQTLKDFQKFIEKRRADAKEKGNAYDYGWYSGQSLAVREIISFLTCGNRGFIKAVTGGCENE